MRHILVVDDEPKIRRVLRAYLEQDLFTVTEAGTGPEALQRLDTTGSGAVDLVILDVGLPGFDGLEVLRRIRAESDLPVILVTARAEEVDRIVGLEVGADDYVTKPFSPREVVARVKTVLRRAGGGPSAGPGPDRPADLISAAGLAMDLPRREVSVDGRSVSLSALEFDLLAALAAHPGRVFSRTQLLEHVWGYDFYGDPRVVDVHISSIRRALADDAASPRFIGTVRGVGYRFVGDPR